MNAAPPGIKGRCPGVLAPMRSGDGLIARLRPRGAALSADALDVLAGAARQLGNGLADLTSQGNIQLRGLDETGAAALAHRLAPLGLLDEDAAAEARRNIIVSPLNGRDPARLIDIAPLAAALAAQLQSAHDLASLPAKFTFLIDDGGDLSLGGVRADLRFEARRAQPPLEARRAHGGVAFAVKAGGDSASATTLGMCPPDRLPEVAIALARRNTVSLPHAAASVRGGANADDCMRACRSADAGFVAALAPWGRLTAAMLEALARAARASALGEIRLTPWRVALVPIDAPAARAALRARLAQAGFVVTSGDPRARVAACVGAPACASATTDVRTDASYFASVLAAAPAGASLHVSGCAKGCAHSGAAAVTLVGRDGRYDLVRNANAQAAPAEPSLSRDAAKARLADIFATEETCV